MNAVRASGASAIVVDSIIFPCSSRMFTGTAIASLLSALATAIPIAALPESADDTAYLQFANILFTR